jgi:diguanylate cyclase (GGDEF)-like protein
MPLEPTDARSLPTTPADILIVDDVPENIRLLSIILDAKGYQTRKATNGNTALRAVEAMLPSLILLDIRMPQMSGYEVCQQLKSNPRTAEIPIIFLSAADEIADKVEAFNVGGADYITKPFHVEEVLARVHHQLTILAAHNTIRELNSQLEARVKERTQQLEMANELLTEMAFRDGLTHLPNRTLLMQQLHTVLSEYRANLKQQFAVLYLDCDRFKTVNDSLGHQAGDELLIAISQRLQSVLGQADGLFRLGGDEFVILLTNLADSKTATQMAERVLNHFAVPFLLREREIFISLSIGVVFSSTSYQDSEVLLRDAATAMYRAKALGKDQYQCFELSMYEFAWQRLQLETDLRKALQQQELVLYYQPIIDLMTEKMTGVEALVRWMHPEQGLIPPDQFIPIAEETGLILKLGLWALQEACYQLRQWQRERVAGPAFTLSVNVSAYQFAQSNFVEQLDKILADTQVDPHCLKLEITETVIMQNVSSAAEVIAKLQERAIQLSIDDFGTGYSSLNYLHSFPIDMLKIDRSFTQRLHHKNSSLGLVTAIVQIAKTMGIAIVAEGIETNEQLAQLKLLGCNYGQGYLFAKPLPARELFDFLPMAHLTSCHQMP